MKLCDRCYYMGDYRASTKTVAMSSHETVDLCESCYEGLMEYINSPVKGDDGHKRARKTTGRAETKDA